MAQHPVPASDSSPRSRRILLVVVPVVVLAVVVAGAVWFLRGDAPDAVSLDGAAAGLERPTTTGTPGSTAGSTASSAQAGGGAAPTTASGTGSTLFAPTPLGGTWVVDSSIGTFDLEKSTGSFVGFRVKEELRGIGSTTAVGRTPAVSGKLVLGSGAAGGGAVSSVAVSADLTKLVTNDSRRDGAARTALGTAQFPTATFNLRTPIPLDNNVASGRPVSVMAEGELTIKGVTRTVQIPLEARLVDVVIVVVGSLDVVFADYGVKAPSAPIVVSVEDRGTVELQLFFRRA